MSPNKSTKSVLVRPTKKRLHERAPASNNSGRFLQRSLLLRRGHSHGSTGSRHYLMNTPPTTAIFGFCEHPSQVPKEYRTAARRPTDFHQDSWSRWWWRQFLGNVGRKIHAVLVDDLRSWDGDLRRRDDRHCRRTSGNGNRHRHDLLSLLLQELHDHSDHLRRDG